MIVLLRAATEDDLAGVGALHYRSRASAYAHFLSPEALTFGADGALGAWWAERFRWERDTHRMTIAEEDGEIVGFTYLGPGEEADTTELNAIHVDPAYQGTGVGRALMIDALAHLGDRAVLWVLEGNDRARRFYERGGWAFDGTVREVPWDHEITRQLRYAYTAGLIGGRERATD